MSNGSFERRVFPIDITSIVFNLVINSIEAFAHSKVDARRITISLSTTDEFIFTYSDNGSGIPDKFENPYDIFKFGILFFEVATEHYLNERSHRESIHSQTIVLEFSQKIPQCSINFSLGDDQLFAAQDFRHLFLISIHILNRPLVFRPMGLVLGRFFVYRRREVSTFCGNEA